MENCAICGGALTVTKDQPYDYSLSGLDVKLLGIPQYKCQECGENFVTIPSPEKLHKIIGVEICRKKKALLLPAEIKFLRKELSLKAQDLARALGVEPATASRWESGKKQIGEGSDRLLRTMFLSCVEDPCPREEKCNSFMDFLLNLPTKRKDIKEKETLAFNPQEWITPEVACCS